MTVEEARRRAAVKQGEANVAQQEANLAEINRNRAASAYEDNPNPQTQGDLETANQNAANTTLRLAEARDAANVAELRSIQAQIAAGTNQVAGMQQAVDGLKIDTNFNWDTIAGVDWRQFINGLTSVVVKGTAHKLIYGFSVSIAVALKVYVALAARISMYGVIDKKVLLGFTKAKILGMKKDKIVGAKYDEVVGVKYQIHQGPKIILGPKKNTKYPTRNTNAVAKAETIAKKKYEIGEGEEQIGTGDMDIETLLETVGDLSSKVNQAKRELQTLEIQVETSVIRLNTFNIEGGSTGVIASGDVSVKAPGGNSIVLTGKQAKIGNDGCYIKLTDKIKLRSGGKNYLL